MNEARQVPKASILAERGFLAPKAEACGNQHRREDILTYDEKCAQIRGLCPDHGWISLHALSRYQS